MKSKTLLFCIAVLAYSVSFAQVKYTNTGYFIVGPISPMSIYNNNMYGSAYFQVQNGSKYFQIDISPAATRLASHYDQVVFYNTQKSIFNSIQVQNVYQYSDERAKTNITPINSGLELVKKLKPVSYNFIVKSEMDKERNLKDIGLLAQEVEAILPEAVITDKEGRKLINYTSLIPVLIKAVQDLQGEIETLKSSK